MRWILNNNSNLNNTLKNACESGQHESLKRSILWMTSIQSIAAPATVVGARVRIVLQVFTRKEKQKVSERGSRRRKRQIDQI